jgi:hypothetical protein
VRTSVGYYVKKPLSVVNGKVIYDGEWKEGKRHGKGKELRDGEIIYRGNYKSDKRNGEGIEYNKGRIVFQGIWSDGKKDYEKTNPYQLEINKREKSERLKRNLKLLLAPSKYLKTELKEFPKEYYGVYYIRLLEYPNHTSRNINEKTKFFIIDEKGLLWITANAHELNCTTYVVKIEEWKRKDTGVTHLWIVFKDGIRWELFLEPYKGEPGALVLAYQNPETEVRTSVGYYVKKPLSMRKIRRLTPVMK